MILENTGTVLFSPQARLILSPSNDLAQLISEQPMVYQNGRYSLTFPLLVPPAPGTYVYTFNPVQVTQDLVTGEDIRIPAGDPVQFTVTVGTDGTVTVTSP